MKFTHVIGGSLATRDSNKSNRAQVLLHTCMVILALHIFQVLTTADAALLQKKLDIPTMNRNVKGCPEKCVCELSYRCESLKIRDCLEDPKDELYEVLHSYPHIESLEISHSHLTMLPYNMLNMTQLIHIDLNTNNLERVPSELLSLTNLKYVSLLRKRIDLLPCDWSKLTQLTVLRLGFNRIKSIRC